MIFPLNWVPSSGKEYHQQLEDLLVRMKEYYTKNSEYYSKYISHEWLWENPSYLPFAEIRKAVAVSDTVLEVGCGNAAILQCNSAWQHKYTGIEFSQSLINKNTRNYPHAIFATITDTKHYPFPDNKFDLVFSTFVIEHTVHPQLFLDECWRVVKPGGQLIVMAPNFLDHGWMPSQRMNRSGLGVKQSLKRGWLMEAISTFVYGRIIIPLKCLSIRKSKHQFVVNLEPCGLETNVPEVPDMDAIYVTSFKEIQAYLQNKGGKAIAPSAELAEHLHQNRLGLLRIQKN